MGDYFRSVGGTVGLVAITGAAAATAVYMAFSPTPISSPVNIDNLSCEILNSGGARQSRLAPPGGFTSFLYEDAKTLYEMMHRGHKMSENGNCLGYKISKTEYAWISYNEVIERSRNIASGLVHIEMKPGQNSFVGVYSPNSVEWILTEHACYNQSAVIVPLYDTLGPNACSFIINQAEISHVICNNDEKTKALLEKKDDMPCLKHIIVINGFSNETKQLATEKGVQLNTLKKIEELGSKNPVGVIPPRPEDIATVCYTSGTTGYPKGVMLTHANIVIDICSVIQQLGEYAPNKDDVMMSFLPLAHMFERICEVLIFMNGGSVGFFGGDVRNIVDDLKCLKPTFMPTVPRFFNRIYDKVIAKANSSLIQKNIFKFALRMKQNELEKSIVRNNSLWDRVVFKPVREEFGGRVRLLVCGSAPLAGHVLNFFRCALGCLILEGYGQTECTAACSMNFQGDYSVEQVGPPLSCCHIKLIDVPEMEYFGIDNKGEICIRGLNIFKCYFKDDQKTKETMDADGWLHTGDIGMWLPNGSLKIIDRKKHIFKLSQGEYIAPEKIENIYLSSEYVNNIFVHGESLQSCLVAIVVPDEEVLSLWCKEKAIKGSWEEICGNKAVKDLIFNDITDLGEKGGLKSFEQVKDIHVHSGLFTVENGLLTPTFKTKRSDCKKCFKDAIESMYRRMA